MSESEVIVGLASVLIFGSVVVLAIYSALKASKEPPGRLPGHVGQEEHRPELRQAVHSIVQEHIHTLRRKRAQTLRYDDYGVPVANKWHSEIDYFVSNVAAPALGLDRLSKRDIMTDGWERRSLERVYAGTPFNWRDEAKVWVAQWVEEAERLQGSTASFDDSMSPADFERFCATKLTEAGWNTTVTSFSGDQGVDVIAEKDGLRVVLQCKKHSRAIGNKAVQEIAAGRAHEQADAACVVSNKSFTKSAIELAATNGVHLLHYIDLERLDTIVRQ